jgi:hypothetical protein
MLRHRKIEEEFQSIAPQGWQGVPVAAPIVVGLDGGEDSGTSSSQASQEIALLEAQFRQQTAFLQTNLRSLQGNSQAGGGSAVEDIASHFGGGFGGLGLLSPVVSGLLSLFGAGGSKSEPDPLAVYTPPPGIQISDTLRDAPTPQTANASPQVTSAAPQVTTAGPQITVHVNAMDSQSFMDRSTDIANAVREAMLNLHPINDVVANL